MALNISHAVSQVSANTDPLILWAGISCAHIFFRCLHSKNFITQYPRTDLRCGLGKVSTSLVEGDTDMAKVSIVVPVCNAGEYILKCLDSIQQQTYSDIKIICIENGSTDDSWDKIISRRDDKRLMAMRVPRAGVSYARNLGLFWALKSSPYVMFSDADDTYEKCMVETMVKGIEEHGTDLACGEIAVQYQTDHNVKHSDEEYYSLKYEGFHNQIRKVINNIDYSLCNKIFLSSIIRKYSITFPVFMHYEDACFCWKYLSVINSIFFIKKKLYNYVRHENSIMNQTFAKSKRSIDHIHIADDIYEFLEKNNLSGTLREEFSQFYMAYLDLAKHYSDEETSEEIEKLDIQLQKKFFAHEA